MYKFHPSDRDWPTEDERVGCRMVMVLEEVEEMETPSSSCCPVYSTDEERAGSRMSEKLFSLSSGPI